MAMCLCCPLAQSPRGCSILSRAMPKHAETPPHKLQTALDNAAHKNLFKVGLSTENPPQRRSTMLSPTNGMAENRLVITVAPQKLIWPQGNTYPMKAVAIIKRKIVTPSIHNKLARLLVRTVIHPAEHMNINSNKEERRTIGMQITQQPAIVHVTHNAFNTFETHNRHGLYNAWPSTIPVKIIVTKHDHGNRTKIPEIIEVFRRWKNAIFLLHHRENRKTSNQPILLRDYQIFHVFRQP